VGDYSIGQLTNLIIKLEKEKMKMKQEKARKVQENNFEIEKEIREKLNSHIVQKLLEKSYHSENQKVISLRRKLQRLVDNQ
jgi:hypothetical protein